MLKITSKCKHCKKRITKLRNGDWSDGVGIGSICTAHETGRIETDLHEPIKEHRVLELLRQVDAHKD